MLTILVITDADPNLVGNIIDLVTGKTQAELTTVSAKTQQILTQAQLLEKRTEPPQSKSK